MCGVLGSSTGMCDALGFSVGIRGALGSSTRMCDALGFPVGMCGAPCFSVDMFPFSVVVAWDILGFPGGIEEVLEIDSAMCSGASSSCATGMPCITLEFAVFSSNTLFAPSCCTTCGSEVDGLAPD